MNEITPFGAWLRDQRKALDLTREDLAARVGCSWSTIKKIEMGERRPSRQIAELLAASLEIPPTERPAFLRFARATPSTCTTTVVASEHIEATGASTAALESAARPATNLPERLTPLVGRDTLLAAVQQALTQDGTRLLTLVGPPGVGKTRLAQAAATGLRAAFPDGVFFVSLDAVREAGLLMSAILAALGLPDSEGRPVAALGEVLGERRVLLLLDNFERVVDAGPLVVELLAACPALQVLVTSLVPLHVRGEQQISVPPLDLPDLTQLPPLAELAACAAVRLFIERARAVRFDFALTAENAAAVAGICTRLDGLPLAIELVAARSKLLQPQALLDRLQGAYGETPLQMLTNGPRDLPPRHRALREAIAWSYHLLQPEEQMLFARLAVFAGGCTLPAVQAVCNALGDLEIGVLDGVQSLLDKSLLREAGASASEPRFAMLSTIREFALEKLTETGTAPALRGWHAEYFQALAETADPQLAGREQKEWVARLAGEHDNIREALRWALDQGQIALAARLVGAVWRFWLIQGYLTEGRYWLERVVAAGGALPADLRARVLHGAGALADNQDDSDRARELYTESLTLRRASGHQQGIAHLLNNLGTVEYHRRNYAPAQALFEESLALKRALGDEPGLASSLNNLGLLAHDQGESDRAIALFEESLARARALGHAHGTTVALNNLAYEQRYQGEYTCALALYAEARTLALELGSRRELGSALHGLADLARVAGDGEAARDLYRQALTIRQELGDRRNIALSLLGSAALLAGAGQWEPACRLFAAAETAFRLPLATLPPAEHAEYAPLLAQVHTRLGQPIFAAAWTAGAALSPARAVAEALTALATG